MRVDLTGRRTRVLVRDPGPRVAETVHALIEEGARVDVEGSNPVVADLAHRGLVTTVTEPDYPAYDLVLRDLLGEPPSGATKPTQGRVVLVGGGPGNPDLLTLGGLAALREADVVVCDRLAPLGILDTLDPRPEVIHVGKIPRGEHTPQERINEILVEQARAGRTVVRLKGGDSFVFGRGGEEWNACVAAGIPVSVVPGVTSSIAAPALAGIPVTHRDVTQGFVVVSGHVGPGDPRGTVDWAVLARTGMTLVILMGVAVLDAIATTLVAAGLDPATPAACIADAGMPSQRIVRGTVTSIAGLAAAAGIGAPAVTVIGPAVDALSPAPDDLSPASGGSR